MARLKGSKNKQHTEREYQELKKDYERNIAICDGNHNFFYSVIVVLLGTVAILLLLSWSSWEANGLSLCFAILEKENISIDQFDHFEYTEQANTYEYDDWGPLRPKHITCVLKKQTQDKPSGYEYIRYTD